MDCSLCRDTGWLLEAKTRNDVMTLELIPCLIPDCPHSGKEIKLLSLNDAKFTRCNQYPNGESIMSVAKGE